MVPPHRGDEDRVPGPELGDLCARQRLAEMRIFVEVGIAQVDHAHRPSRRSVIERPDIKVGELVGGEQSEAAAPDRAAGKVVRKIVMRRNPCAGADPDAFDRLAYAKVNVVGLVQTVEIILHIDRREIDGGCVAAPFIGLDPREDFRKVSAAGAEVHRQRFAVEQPIARARLPDVYRERPVAAMCEQIGARRRAAVEARLDQRPIGNQPAHHEWRAPPGEQRIELARRELLLGHGS